MAKVTPKVPAKKTGAKVPAKKTVTKDANPFAAKLQKQASLWKKAKERAATEPDRGADLENGKYIAMIKAMEVVEFNGKLKVQSDWLVLKGDAAGTVQRTWDGLETEDNLVHFMKKVARYGYDTDDLDATDVPALCKTMVEDQSSPARIQVKGWDGGVNVYVQELLTGESLDDYSDVINGEGSAAEPATEEEEEEVAGAADDGLDAMDRKELIAKINELKASGHDIKALKSDDDDGLRAKIRAIEPAAEEEEVPAEEEEEEEAPAEEGEAELTVGMTVVAPFKGKEVKGKVTAIDDEAETVKITPAKGQSQTKVFTVPVSSIELLDE